MSKTTIMQCVRLIFCAALVFSSILQAQANRLYRVELIVFSRAAGAADEQWEATPVLKYPHPARFLIDPSQVKSKLAEQYSDNATDSSGRPTPATPVPTQFVTLPNSQLQFRGKAAYMQKSGRYRILFHESWLQPIGSKSQAPSIVLDRSGDDQQWPQLQGSIKLYQSRYLFLETNLWMNTDGEYLHSQWSMPPPPLGPVSVIAQKPQPAPQTGLNIPAAEHSGEFQPLSQDEMPEDWTIQEVDTGPIYPYRHAVLLKQTRRMRSGEVHYLDHPMMGVIVKVTPVSVEQPETIAGTE